MTSRVSFLLAASLSLFVTPALAASSAWHETEGGRIRLVTTGVPDVDGRLRAALQIETTPGWKTYWRDPGDAGVPPQITFSPESGITEADIAFPAPTRFDEGAAHWAGYKQPVSLALDLQIGKDTKPGPLKADVFLGLCQSICVPVQATLELDPLKNTDDMFDRATVDAAFDSLPQKAREDFGVAGAELDANELIVETRVPSASENVQIFLAGNGGYRLGEPRPEGGHFVIPVLAKPSKPAQTTIHYTLIADGEAVDGQFALP